ncbi:MAG: hypothetical protein AEth_02068 [Candidatus Argoarchaeum ethanivorans]|uniref:Uncharacterized protein n=1 Tax=Candidatus Argoarchaeum ethanivorans TaxID=2608793 RepID=A0A8B3RZU9_9EURY|nr:MAG: hypothetical protein AEth_02068 [Candidatus Argoarchaeum ethanivorans]
MIIEDVRPEGCICKLYLDISPNRGDTRTKFGYTEVIQKFHPFLNAPPFFVSGPINCMFACHKGR